MANTKRGPLGNGSDRVGRVCRCGALALSVLAGPAAAQPPKGATGDAAAILALRDYALTSCIRRAFPAMAEQADAARDFYLQNGPHPAETYMEVQRRLTSWLEKPYPSFTVDDLTLVKCIDFAESAEIGRLATRTLPRTR